MKASKLSEVNQKGLLHHTNVHWCKFISPAWTRRGKPNRTVEKEQHTNVHLCRFISPAWTRRENQSKIKCRIRNSTPTCTTAGLFLLLRPGRETNLRSAAGKGNSTTSQNGSTFTQTGIQVLEINHTWQYKHKLQETGNRLNVLGWLSPSQLVHFPLKQKCCLVLYQFISFQTQKYDL